MNFIRSADPISFSQTIRLLADYQEATSKTILLSANPERLNLPHSQLPESHCLCDHRDARLSLEIDEFNFHK